MFMELTIGIDEGPLPADEPRSVEISDLIGDGPTTSEDEIRLTWWKTPGNSINRGIIYNSFRLILKQFIVM